MTQTDLSEKVLDQAREAMHQKMLSVVSHDLKTPLVTIIGTLEIYTRMEEKLSSEKKASLIQSALGEAYRLDSFITNILDMAKLEGGMVKAKSEKTDLLMIVKDSIIKLGPKANKVTVHYPSPHDSFYLYTDAMLLGRAVGILLDNAIKHSRKSPTITIAFHTTEAKSCIYIRDNGVGIPEDKMEEIFLKHTRIAKSDQQNAGTGLGLAICRHIMTLLSGDVTVKNQESGGAEFTLTIFNKK
jgi:K+-sensing histidine kinase KdpD